MTFERPLQLNDSYSVGNLERLVEKYKGCVIEGPRALKEGDVVIYHLLDATLRVTCAKRSPKIYPTIAGIFAYASDAKKIDHIEGIINCDIRQIATSIH